MLEGAVLPYGLRDVKLIPLDSAGNEGTPVDLPVSQTFSFSETEEYQELRGDDRVVAIVGKGPVAEWSLEAGGISLDAWLVITGGTLTDAGATPNQTKELLKKVTDRRPYFKVIGQSVADGGGDTHAELFKCKCDGNLEGEWTDGEFFISSCSGTALGNATEDLYRITWHETATEIPVGALDEIQLVTIDATGGTFTLTYSGQTTAAIAFDATAAAVENALEALSNIGVDEALVTGAAGGPYTVTFAGTLAGLDLTQMTASSALLTGGSAAAIVQTLQNGG